MDFYEIVPHGFYIPIKINVHNDFEDYGPNCFMKGTNKAYFQYFA